MPKEELLSIEADTFVSPLATFRIVFRITNKTNIKVIPQTDGGKNLYTFFKLNISDFLLF